MEINIYFEPIDIEKYIIHDDFSSKRICENALVYSDKGKFPDIENIDIALIGIKEERMVVQNSGCSEGPDFIRKNFYQLFKGTNQVKFADFGNINPGHTIEDTYYALSTVVEELIRVGILPIILGGSHDLTFAQYKGYNNLGQIMNLLVVDSMLDIGKFEDAITSRTYLSKIILHQPNFLFNLTNLGYQSYLVDQEAIKLYNQLFFDTYRIGNIRNDMEEVEPIIRNCDMISLDISSIRFADAPGNSNTSPNGFNGEEICKIMRYAGMSDKLSSLGIYEYNPSLDIREQTAKLIAQMIWYFIDGFYSRKQDYPVKNMANYLKFLVKVEEHSDEIVFYKSKKSERWWMEIPVEKNLKSRYARQYIIPCSNRDYQIACEDVIPERWWQFYQKLV